MTVSQIIGFPFVDDNTRFVIYDFDYRVVMSGNWFNDDVLGYHDYMVDTFTYIPGLNKIYVTVC